MWGPRGLGASLSPGDSQDGQEWGRSSLARLRTPTCSPGAGVPRLPRDPSRATACRTASCLQALVGLSRTRTSGGPLQAPSRGFLPLQPRPWAPLSLPRQPGHTVSVDCQECTCEGGTQTMSCRPRTCPPAPACPESGQVPVPEAMQTGQCCPQYRCGEPWAGRGWGLQSVATVRAELNRSLVPCAAGTPPRAYPLPESSPVQESWRAPIGVALRVGWEADP